jgi:hypothetical protein
MSETLVLRLKNYPESQIIKNKKIEDKFDADSEDNNYSNLSSEEIKKKVKYIQDCQIEIINEAISVLSSQNDIFDDKTKIKDYLESLVNKLIIVQKEILKLCNFKEVIHELHNIFVYSTNFAIIYINEFYDLIHNKNHVYFERMNDFLKMTILKFGSLILFIPAINRSIIQNCKDSLILKSLMSKLVVFLLNFSKTIARSIISPTNNTEYFTNLWEGFSAFDIVNILPTINKLLNSIKFPTLDPVKKKIVLQKHSIQLNTWYKDTLGNEICNKLINIVHKFPEMLKLIMENPGSHFIHIDLIGSMYIYCVTQLLLSPVKYEFVQFEKIISYFSDVLIDIINTSNSKLKQEFIKLKLYINDTNKKMCTEINNKFQETPDNNKKQFEKKNEELDETITKIEINEKDVSAAAAAAAATAASISISAVCSVMVKYDDVISIVNGLILSRDIAESSAVKVAKSAAHFAKLRVAAAFNNIKKIKTASSSAANNAIIASHYVNNIVNNVFIIVNKAVIKRKQHILQEASKRLQIKNKLIIDEIIDEIITKTTCLSYTNKIIREAIIVAKNAAKSAKLAAISATKITIYSAANRIAIHSITAIINTAKNIIIQKGIYIKNPKSIKHKSIIKTKDICNFNKDHFNDNYDDNINKKIPYEFVTHKLKIQEQRKPLNKHSSQINYLKQLMLEQKEEILEQKKQILEQKEEIFEQKKQIQELQVQTQYQNAQLYHHQNQIDYLFRMVNCNKY